MKQAYVSGLLSFLGAVVGAWSLYYGGRRPRKGWRRGSLMLLRAGVCGGLVYLLLSPVMEYRTLRKEPAAFVVVWDNSRSMLCCVDTVDLKKRLNTTQKRLKKWAKEQKIQLYWHFLDESGGADPLVFRGNASRIGPLLKEVLEGYEQMPVGGLLLVSDGIYNQGISPEQLAFPYKTYALGVGDTLERRDVVLKRLLYNKVVHQAVTHMSIEGLISQRGYGGRWVEVQLKDEKGQSRGKKRLRLPVYGLATVRFELPVGQAASYRYSLQVSPLKGEVSRKNNRKDAFIEVLKDKIRLLVLAPYPHPDVAALTRALSRRRYYQTDVVVLSAGTKVPKKATYDVALLYDAFGAPEMEEIYAKLQRKKTPLWWFFTDRSRLPSTSSTLGITLL